MVNENEKVVKPTYEKVRKFEITKGIDLIKKVQEEPEPKIVWNGIPEGSKGLIAGVAKTGKTTLAEALAISIAVGRKEFFGYPLSGNPEKVLFINLEESYRIRSRRNQKQIAILNQEELGLFAQNYISTPEDFPEFLETEENWADIRDYIMDSDAKIVFIDSLSHMFKGIIENSEPSLAFVKKFREYVGTTNKTIIIIHHNTKGNEKPIDQDSIAGSRIITQEFEYAIGLGNIPTQKGGNYQCMLYNKHIEKDDTSAILYRVNSDNWVENIGKANKFDLYKDSKTDYRIDPKNKELVYNYILSQGSQGSQTILTSELMEEFVEGDTRIMSKDTLYNSLDKLINEGKIVHPKKGEYQLKMKMKNGGE